MHIVTYYETVLSFGSKTNSHDSFSQLEEFRDIVEDFHHGPVKA